MLALFCRADGELSIVESDIVKLPPDPASDLAGRVYALQSLTAVTVVGEPQILCLYVEVPMAEELSVLRSIPVERAE